MFFIAFIFTFALGIFKDDSFMLYAAMFSIASAIEQFTLNYFRNK